MEAWQSWTVFGLAAGGIAYYYVSTSGQKKRAVNWRPFTPQQARARNSSKTRKDSRDRRAKETVPPTAAEDTPDASEASAQASGSDNVKKRKGAKGKQQSKLAQSTTVNIGKEVAQDEAEEQDDGDLEFAKQLSQKKTGTSLKKPEGVQQNKQARKQAKRTEAALSAESSKPGKSSGSLPQQEISTASSTDGRDGDDDRSSATSADLIATGPSGADVSDMLEAPAKGPSVLRVTSPTNPQPQKQPKAQKPVQEQETKKQRQNRRKREEEKAMREEAEKQRKKLLEDQRRTAREAEGRSAKNGLGTSQQPTKNAWSTTTKAGGNADTTRVPAPQNTQLLDTFEDNADAGDNENASAGKSQPKGSGYGTLPSEEEQINMLKEMDSDNGWNTVAKGGKKKKADNAPALRNDAGTGNQSKASSTADVESTFPKGAAGTALNAQANKVATSSKLPTESSKKGKATRETIDHSVWNRSNIHEHPDYDPSFPYALTGHPDDSDWAVV